MYVYIYMCVCVRMHVCVSTNVCIHACMHKRTHIGTIYIYIYMCVCVTPADQMSDKSGFDICRECRLKPVGTIWMNCRFLHK